MNPTNQVQLIDIEHDLRWDQFVENHPYGQISHLSTWKHILENSFNHINGYNFALIDKSSQSIIAALPVYTVKSWLTGNRVVSIPFATLCNPLITDENQLEVLIEAVARHARVEKCKTIEIKSFLNETFSEIKQFAVAANYVIQEIPISEPLDSILSKFHPLVRRSIRRAEKSGFKIKKIKHTKELTQFYGLYSNTRKRIGLPTQPFLFFKNMREYLTPSDHLTTLMVLKDNKPVAAAFFFKFKNRFSLEYTGWDRKYHKECPNHFLYLEAIKQAKCSGFEIFDLGRTALSNHQLMEFKSRWGASCQNLQQHYFPAIINKRLDNKEASLQYRLVSKICHLLPKWGFERFSDFCYRHIG